MTLADPLLDTRAMTNPAAPHILVVEDDREISALVARYLRGNDCRVTIAGTVARWTGHSRNRASTSSCST